MKCQLCQSEVENLVKAHIYPIGFFNNIETKGKVTTFDQDGKKKRRLQKAIYDPNILCRSCEKKISIYDDYAIKVFRDKEDSFEVISPNHNDSKLLIFNSIDKRKLRGFIASLLWRISKSEQEEIASLSIEKNYERLIAEEIKNGGDFSYIDVFASVLTSYFHNSFLTPCEIVIDPIDLKRDPFPVSGWEISLPNLLLRVSLDKREHPNNFYVCIPPEFTGKVKKIKASTSLNTEDDYQFMFLITEMHEGYAEKISTICSNIQNYNKK